MKSLLEELSVQVACGIPFLLGVSKRSWISTMMLGSIVGPVWAIGCTARTNKTLNRITGYV